MNKQPVIIRTFDTPTNVHIIGNDFENLTETFSITDDYASFCLKMNDRVEYCDTCGFVYIMSDDEYDKYKDNMDYDDQCHIYIENYMGNIGIKLIDNYKCKFGDYESAIKLIDNSKNYLPINFNHKEYLDDYYDNDDNTHYPEVIVSINCNYNQIKILS